MSHIAIVGGGHVGAVYAAGLAKLKHRVSIIESDPSRARQLRSGKAWFYEPQLSELLGAGVKSGRLRATSSYREGLRDCEFIFICVPTPIALDGNLDDSYVSSAIRSILAALRAGHRPIVVNKSTVPVGTTTSTTNLLSSAGIPVVSSPEFLAQGRAVEDFFHPGRIVIGSASTEVALAVAALFKSIKAPLVLTDPVTAELIKLASNAFLATKISFANALSTIGTRLGADVGVLVQGVGLDPRIGGAHMRPGLGYGGSCLPKDLAALEHLARKVGAPYDLFAGTSAVNRYQRTRVIDELASRLGGLEGQRIAILGAAFKADTDDIRESPGVEVARELLAFHATVVIWDPRVSRKILATALPGARIAADPTAALRGADAAVIATDWPELRTLDVSKLRQLMKRPLLVDGRGAIDRARVKLGDLEYVSLAD